MLSVDGPAQLRFYGTVVAGFRNWVGVWVPETVMLQLGTRGRPAVAGSVNGAQFQGSLVPTGRGHFMWLNKTFRHGTGIDVGDRVEVVVALVTERPAVEMPAELEAALSGDPEARRWWEALSASKHRIAMTWIGQARALTYGPTGSPTFSAALGALT